MKITYLTGSRAEFGIMLPVLKKIQESKKLQLDVVVTAQHLSPKFGKTVDYIKKSGIRNIKSIKIVNGEYSSEEISKYVGICISELAMYWKNIKPDILLVFGDRWETFAAVTAACYMNIPIVHIHGGDKTIGTQIDNPIRYAITKLSHIHLAATEQSAKRIEMLGEEKFRIMVVGSPSMDAIREMGLQRKPVKDLVIILQHPVSSENYQAAKQITETIEAVKDLGMNAIIIYPGLDTGADKMIDAIEKYRNDQQFTIVKNIERGEYLKLLSTATVIVGNSSGGIIDTAALGVPSVNVGTRQTYRERAGNVIDVGYNKNEIKKAIIYALTDKFSEEIKKTENPYGDGRSAERIVKILEEIDITNRLLIKTITY